MSFHERQKGPTVHLPPKAGVDTAENGRTHMEAGPTGFAEIKRIRFTQGNQTGRELRWIRSVSDLRNRSGEEQKGSDR
jgi:hypothetical protein